jgi:hypothetical protein
MSHLSQHAKFVRVTSYMNPKRIAKLCVALIMACIATEPPRDLFCPSRSVMWRERQLRLLNLSKDNRCILECSQSSKNKDKEGGAGYSKIVHEAVPWW